MNFFESFEQGMDAQLAHYLSNTAASLCAIIAPAVAAGIVIYIILIGYAIIRGEAQDSLHSTMWKVVKWSLVAALALSAGGFNTFVVGGLNGIETGLFQATTGAASGGVLLDDCLTKYIDLFNLLVQNVKTDGAGVFPNVAVCFAILMLAIASLIFFGLAVCVFMLAKVALVLVIALGPAFIATLIFPPIQRFADAWLSAALNTVIIKVLAGIILAISTLFLKGIVERTSGNFETTAILMDCLKILILSVSFGAIFGYLPMLAAQLVGGAPMPYVTMPRIGRGSRSSQPRTAPASFSGGQIQQGRNVAAYTLVPAYRRNVIGHLNR
ncbi:MAG: type IV secretion system protein [Asticcacaulis sp.]|uniref:type IV secretion system protein n=1 Tax=Asticcacaulis sp. TaxID=1872648 RepID=UPI003F7B6B84